MSHKGKVWVALVTVYLIWGSTYLGIELAGETIPPLFAVGVRFVLAGVLMAGLTAAWRGAAAFRVTRAQLGSAVVVGALLPGANAVLFVAERHVPTGLARTGAQLTQWAPGAPLTTDQIAMIEAGDNVTSDTDAVDTFQFPLVALEEQIRRAA